MVRAPSSRRRALFSTPAFVAVAIGSAASASADPPLAPAPTTSQPIMPQVALPTMPTAPSMPVAPGTAEPSPARPAPAPGKAPAIPPADSGGRIPPAVDALATWAATAKANVGAYAVDVESGAVLFALNEHRVMNPASNAKVLTAAAVLDAMGPDYRFTTALHGKSKDGVVAPLVLRGNGDPSLETDELFELASALKAQGVKRVDGVLVDQSYFDDSYVPPAFAQQPNEWAPFRAPVSAVSLERNAVTLNVVPGKPGSPATIWFDPPGFVDIHGSIDTRPGSADGARWTLVPTGPRLRAELSGFVGEGAPRFRFTKRVDDPRLLAGFALAEVMRQMGIEVRGDVLRGGDNVHPRLAYVESAPLAVLVRELGKNSDNFYAETLLKALGAFVKDAPPARTADGAAAVLAFLTKIGASEAGTRVVNGSGLFDANRVSARTVATVLRHAYMSSRIGPDFVAQLAVGGVDGTLRSRFRSRKDERSVRAKTGTLDDVVALGGYVLAPPGGRGPVAFSFIVDGVAGRHTEARERIDKCVDALAASVRSRQPTL